MGLSARVPALIRARPLAVLSLLCLLAWLPGFFTLPPLDRDESRFAQATKQMLETGNFVDIRLGGTTRYEKPVGIYWLQAASTAALGDGVTTRIWTYRVPSLLGALAAVLGTFALARAFASIDTAFVAALVLGFSALLATEAHIAKTDAVLAATVVAAQAVVLRAYLSAREPSSHPPPSLALALGGWAAFGLGVLVKGPLVALVCGLTALGVSLWDRDWHWVKRLYPGRGILIALLIVLPWMIAIGVQSHGAFFQKSLGGDFASKMMGDQEAHGAPPGYFTLLTPATFWPGSLFLIPALVLGFRRRREPALRFLLTWVAVTFLIFEFTPTKLPHYVLPAYPALAALAGVLVTDAKAWTSRAVRIGAIASLALFVLVGIVAAAFLFWAPMRFGDGSPALLAALCAAVVLAVLAVIPLSRARRTGLALSAACGAAILLYSAAGDVAAPRLSALWLSPRMAESAARFGRASDPPVRTAGYSEPSITFLLGTSTVLDDGATAGQAAAARGGLVLVEAGQKAEFLAAVAKAGAHADELDEIDGLNYSRGRRARITLYRIVPHGA